MRRHRRGELVVWGLMLAGCGSSEAGSEHDSETGAVSPPRPACAEAADGGDREVSMPVLIAELGDRWHESWLASPVAVDLDGDGVIEVISARHGLVLGWHLDGEVVFRQEVDGRCWAPTVVADLRPDIPGLEVAQASADAIYVWDAHGNALPGFPFRWRGELRSLAAADITGDGRIELVSVTTQNLEDTDPNGIVQRDIVIAVRDDGSIVPGFPPNTTGASGCDDACYVYNGYDQNIALGDVDGDGVADVFATQDNAYNSLHRGDGFAFDAALIFSGRSKFHGIRGLHDYGLAQRGWPDDADTALQAHHTNTAPAIADLDGDGMAELIYLASVQNAAQDRREQGVALWVLRADGTRPDAWVEPLHVPGYLSGLWDYGATNIVAITNQVTVAEINPTRRGRELVFAGFDGQIHAIDAYASELWSVRYTDRDDVATGGVVVADLSGDGVPELVFATYSTEEGRGELILLDAGGNLLHRLPLPKRGAMAVPTIADADGDGTLDIIVALKDGGDGEAQVHVYRVPGSSDNCLLWPTGRANLQRNGWIP